MKDRGEFPSELSQRIPPTRDPRDPFDREFLS